MKRLLSCAMLCVAVCVSARYDIARSDPYMAVADVDTGGLQWIDGKAVRKAWLALCAHLDEHANLSDVCAGTGKKNDLQYYFDRPRVNGDPHGQAPMLWLAAELIKK